MDSSTNAYRINLVLETLQISDRKLFKLRFQNFQSSYSLIHTQSTKYIISYKSKFSTLWVLCISKFSLKTKTSSFFMIFIVSSNNFTAMYLDKCNFLQKLRQTFALFPFSFLIFIQLCQPNIPKNTSRFVIFGAGYPNICT